MPVTIALPRSHRPSPPPTSAALDEATRDLVLRAAAHPDGLALVLHGQLECVATLLRVHPRAVERARRALEDPAVRAAAEAALAGARDRIAALEVPVAPPAAAPRRSAEAVVREAERREGGVELLASGSPECAAVVFSVTPAVVLAARELLARRAVRPG
jgi:hypothetical protein